jgi:hypothetical protein
MELMPPATAEAEPTRAQLRLISAAEDVVAIGDVTRFQLSGSMAMSWDATGKVRQLISAAAGVRRKAIHTPT